MRALGGLLGAVVVCALCGCGPVTTTTTTASGDATPLAGTRTFVPAADGGRYFFEQTRRTAAAITEAVLTGSRLSRLDQALPNQYFEIEGGETFRFADLVAIGDLESVTELEGHDYGPGDGDGYVVVGFDDPRADEVLAQVTMRLTRHIGEDTGSDRLTFQIGAPARTDPERYFASLAGLDDVVVFLHRSRDGLSRGRLFPIESRVLIGTIDPDGLLRFPALGRDEAAYLGELTTPARLVEAATRPPTTSPYDDLLTVPVR